ncbi:MAG: H(+)/Cl(-) exchange transporter ClcA [Moorellales bacterium]
MAVLQPELHTTGTRLLSVWRSMRFRLLVEGMLAGLVAGLAAVAFRLMLTKAEVWRDYLLDWARGDPARWAVAALVLVSAGAAAGYLTGRAPETAGSGIPHVAAVLRRQRNLNWRRVLPIKVAGGVLAIGAGLSLGREGPTVQIGAAAGQMVSRALVRPKVEEKYLVACGAGAGLAAAFNAPLAGVIFVLEELQRNFSPYLLGTAWAASVTADLVSQYFLGPLPTFRITGLPRLPLAGLPFAALLGAVSGLLGLAFNYALRRSLASHDRFGDRPSAVRPLLACALAVAMGYYLPQVLGGGHALAEAILTQKIAFELVPLLFMAKFLLTMVSYGAGVPGGIFLPLLVLGALGGAYFGYLVAPILPGPASMEATFAVVGMAALFTAVVRAPITGIVLVIEMTGSYQNMLPLFAACVVAYVVAEILKNPPVYEMLFEQDEAKRKTGVNRESTSLVELVELVVEAGSRIDGRRIKDSGLPEDCLLVAVRRGNRELLPHGKTRLLSGDHVTLLAPEHRVEAIAGEFFRAPRS